MRPANVVFDSRGFVCCRTDHCRLKSYLPNSHAYDKSSSHPGNRRETAGDGLKLGERKGNALDNIGHTGGLVVTGIHRPLWRQPDSHPNRGGSDHLDLQPGLRPALVSAYTVVRSRSLIS